MNPSSDDDALPVWPVATIALLTTMDEAPHAIPVTAPFRAGERHILLALKQTRESLARLRKCPRVSLSIFGSGDLAVTIKAPAGAVPSPYSHRLLAQEPLKVAGGQVRIVDSTNFPAASTIAAALVEIEPGGLRELHWHTNADEWQYFISGSGRMTVFASSGKARTFDYQAGDVGYVPFAMGHYVQNTGTETLSFLEIFRSPRFVDISLNQWMALTPPELVQAHLNIAPEVIAGLSREKAVIVR